MLELKRWYGIIGILCYLGVNIHATADSLNEQRSRYQTIKTAFDKNDMQTVEQLLPTLESYPLYPYLEYRLLLKEINQIPEATAYQFVTQYPTLSPTPDFIVLFINELTKRQDWHGILNFTATPPADIGASCQFYYAKWQDGQSSEAWHGMNELWLTGDSLPKACDPLIQVWQQAGLQTASETLQRLELAFEKNNSGLINALVKQLPADYTTMSQQLLALQQSPASVIDFAHHTGPTPFTRQMTILGFTRLARQEPAKARSLIDLIANVQKMTSREKLDLEKSVAWRWIGTSDVTAEQAHWRDEVIERSYDAGLVGRRIRMVLADGNRTDLAKWLNALPQDARQEDEWMYWHAMVLLDHQYHSQAKKILQELARKRGFYPMVAAQQLGINYPITVQKVKHKIAYLPQSAEINRIKELMYWNLDNFALNEWQNLLAKSSPEEQTALARYAFQQHWADLSVRATIVGKMWDHLEERFPLAYKNDFKRFTDNKVISAAFAMAIARQESAWNPRVTSSAGARGLMQLMPATAQETAKKSGMTYPGSDSLYNPLTNIRLGTTYLQNMYQQFGNNRILASAAYNAGPGRLASWLKNSGGQLHPVAFIESIPFNETRLYVKNVLAFAYYYNYFLQNQKPKTKLTVLTESEWHQKY